MSMNPHASMMTRTHDVADETTAQPSPAEQQQVVIEAIEAIRRDSKASPDKYLEDSVAPYGGE